MSQQHRREVDGLSSGEEEQLKIEAEIERLLLHAGVDAEENAEAMPHDTTKNISEDNEIECCVEQIFSGYLSTLTTHQEDMKDYITETLKSVAESFGEVSATGDENTWSVEADSKPTGKMIESDFHERDNSTILEYKHADNQHHMSSKTNPSQSDVNVSPQLGDSNKETSHTYSAQGTDCDDHLVGVTSRNSDLDSQDFESDQLSKEHMSGIEEARRHYRNCEETLTNEQREKEAELIFDIEEAQRILAEYDAIQREKAVSLERSQHKAATTIQAYCKGYLIRCRFSKQLLTLKLQRLQRINKAAQLLQAIWRGIATRKMYRPILEIHKANRIKEEAELKVRSATRIQATWRGYHARYIHGPALSVLNQKRIMEARRKEEEISRKLNSGARIIQATWKGQLVRREYVPILKEKMEKWRKERKQNRSKAAIKIQAHWRGVSERKRTKIWLEEQKKKRELFKHNNAACVLQKYWRMHSCRKQLRNLISTPCNQSTSDCAVTPQELPGVSRIPYYDTRQDYSNHNNGTIIGEGKESKRLQKLEGQPENHNPNSISRQIIRGEEEEGNGSQQEDNSFVLQGEIGSRSNRSMMSEVWIDSVQERIKHWILTTTPWKEPCQPTHNPPASKPVLRSQSTRALHMADLLQNSGETDIKEVEEVVLNNTGFVPDLRCLPSCHKLCSLDLRNCGLSAITSLTSNLPLISLNLEANNVEHVNLQDRGSSLRFLNLSENKLGSVHGLEACQNLLYLDISDNRITRLGGLGFCWHLQHLSADSNLLVCCDGLEVLPYLQTLSCSKNHLPRAPDISRSFLLTSLNLQLNNLQEVPRLQNHVLLRELWLDDNSLTDISPLCSAWLPLLQTLSLARNCVSQLGSLVSFIMLATLDIRNNSIYDLLKLQDGLMGCTKLQFISLQGNPVTEEPELLSCLTSVLPSLALVDGQELQQHTSRKCEIKDMVSSTLVYQLCQKQLIERENMMKRHSTEIEYSEKVKIAERLKTQVKQKEDMERLLIRHLKEQESLGKQCLETNSMTRPHQCLAENRCAPRACSSQQVPAAVVLQAAWRGYRTRHSLSLLHNAAVVIQTRWRRFRARCLFLLELERCDARNRAATIIQAAYRGYWIRRKMHEVIEQAKYSSDEGSSLEEDINLTICEEDLDVFPLPPTAPTHYSFQSSKNTLPPNKNASEISCIAEKPKSPELEQMLCTLTRDFDVTTAAKQAWDRGNSSRLTTQSTSTPTSKTKTDYIDEWGFKTNSSAKLLMKRAEKQKKLKRKAAHRKRMTDPVERLAAFHKKSQSAIADPKKCSLKFDTNSPDPLKTAYHWQHDHAVFHRDVGMYSREKVQQNISSTLGTSECSLPQLDKRVLDGHAPMLVALSCPSHGKSSSTQGFVKDTSSHASIHQ